MLKCGGAPCRQGDPLWITGTLADMCASGNSYLVSKASTIIERWKAGKLYSGYSAVAFKTGAVLYGMPDTCGKWLFAPKTVSSPTDMPVPTWVVP